MGLFSNRIARERLQAGDHIYSWRTGYVYAHHGIYVGDDKVIHFTREHGQEVGSGTKLDIVVESSGPPPSQVPCTTCTHFEQRSGVISSCLNCFLSGGILYLFEYAVNPVLFLAKARGGTCTLAKSDPSETVLHRANHLLTNGFGCYSLFNKNCEDFAIYCKTGILAVDNTTLGQSGQAVSFLSGPIAAVISTPLRLVTTNIYGMAATAVVVYCFSRYVGDIGVRKDVVKLQVEDLTAALGRLQLAAETMAIVLPVAVALTTTQPPRLPCKYLNAHPILI